MRHLQLCPARIHKATMLYKFPVWLFPQFADSTSLLVDFSLKCFSTKQTTFISRDNDSLITFYHVKITWRFDLNGMMDEDSSTSCCINVLEYPRFINYIRCMRSGADPGGGQWVQLPPPWHTTEVLYFDQFQNFEIAFHFVNTVPTTSIIRIHDYPNTGYLKSMLL
mgnify:CR=1 FL=1